MDIQRELAYLQDLVGKHGHYLRKYFGFTLKEISQRIGLSPKMFLMIIHGQKKMPPKYYEKFIQVFNEMQIETRTKDFKLTESQTTDRRLRTEINLDRRANWVYSLIMVTFLYYIRCNTDGVKRLLSFFKARFEFYSSLVFLFSKENLSFFCAKPISQKVGFLF